MILLNTFWQILLFITAIIIIDLSPGFVLLSLCKINLSRLEKFILSLGLGIAFSCSLYFFTGFLNVRVIADVIIAIFSIFFIIQCIQKKLFVDFRIITLNERKIFSLIIPFIIIFVCSYFQSSLIFGGGYNPQNGTIIFPQTGDAMWLISLSRELAKNIPPVHPGFAPEIVTNYHYFTHLFMGLIFRFTNISLIDLYFNYFSWFYCLFLGFSTYILGRKIFKNNYLAIILVILTYTAGSFSYLLPFWLGQNFNWNDANFWVSQTFNIILNPAVMLSLSLFNLSLFCFYQYWQEKDQKIILPLILLSGSLISFKVYAGLIVLGAFSLITLYDLYKKSVISLFVLFGTALLSILIFLPVSGKDSSSFLVYAPFWFLHTMVENPDRVNIGIWALKEQYFWATGNIFAVVRLRLLELFIFIAGNLGVRMISLFIFPLILIKKINLNKFISFLLIGFLGGMTIPLFFIQKGSVANTIQFFYYSLIIGNILTVFILKEIYLKKRKLFLFISILIILFAIPTTIKTILPRKNPVIISKNHVESLFALKNLTNKEQIILLPPGPVNLDSMIVSTVSERNSFYAHKLMIENTLKNYDLREKELQQFFYPLDKKSGKEFQKKFIIKYNLNTLYLLNEERFYLKKIYLPYKIIFKNNSAIIIKFL